MVNKLKGRLDKTESGIVQRLKFNIRVLQQSDESLEDFVLWVKLQAEFYHFKNFKEIAIRDRIVAGARDKALQQTFKRRKSYVSMRRKIDSHLGNCKS